MLFRSHGKFSITSKNIIPQDDKGQYFLQEFGSSTQSVTSRTSSVTSSIPSVTSRTPSAPYLQIENEPITSSVTSRTQSSVDTTSDMDILDYNRDNLTLINPIEYTIDYNGDKKININTNATCKFKGNNIFGKYIGIGQVNAQPYILVENKNKMYACDYNTLNKPRVSF